MFRSIKVNIILLCVGIMVILAIGMGSVSLLSISKLTEQHEAENMNRIAEQKREQINTQLIQTEIVVNFVANAINRMVENSIAIQDDGIKASLDADMYDAFQNAIGKVPAVCSYFIFYPGNKYDGNSELWRVRQDNNGEFVPCDKDMIQHGQRNEWYEQPVSSGKPQWIEPHYSEVQGRYIISYVVPIIKDDTVIAVVGADLDFKQLLDIVNRIRVFNTGTAFLLNLSGDTHYTLDYPEGIDASRGGQLKLSHGAMFVPNTSSFELIRYNWNNVEYDMADAGLRNGMALAVAAPVREIYGQAYIVMLQMIVFFILLLIVSILIAFSVGKRITRRLAKIADAAHQVGQGKINIKLPIWANDEIGELCRVLNNTSDKIHGSMEEMHNLTYHDALTGLYNRLGMKKYIKEWFESNADKPAALVSLDLDDFKFTNDIYGHTIGDIALKTLAKLLLEHFADKAFVGRNGGDEFVVFLYDTTKDEAWKKIASFSKLAKSYDVNGKNKSFTTSIGFATYPDSAKNLKELYQQADAALYAVKLKGKANFAIYTAMQEGLSRQQLGFNLRDVAENLPAAIFVHKAAGIEADVETKKSHTEGEVLYASKEMFKLLECNDMDDLLKLIDGDYKNLLPKEDIALLEKAETPADMPLEYSPKQFSVRIRTKSGQKIPVIGCRRLVDSPIHGRIVYVALLYKK